VISHHGHAAHHLVAFSDLIFNSRMNSGEPPEESGVLIPSRDEALFCSFFSSASLGKCLSLIFILGITHGGMDIH
jgi:uncharacterized membrane-anchored protein YitT (DUF2179 family)